MTENPQAAFAAALTAFQTELPHVKKGQTAKVPTKAGGSYSYDYADLTDITEAALPLLATHGLSWTARPTLSEAGFVLVYSLLHTSGYREEGSYPLPDPARSSPQEIGSALTYARRYALCAVTGIAPGGDDDDGQTAANARAADSDSRRTPNSTTRRGAADIDTTASDEWSTPRVTDTSWLAGFRKRLVTCAKPSDLRALREEANVTWAEGKLSDADARELKAEMAIREVDLSEPVGAST